MSFVGPPQPSIWDRLSQTVTQGVNRLRNPRARATLEAAQQPFDPGAFARQRQLELFQQADENRRLGPLEPRGQERLNIELKRNPHKPGTPEYDRWVIALREDPEDPAYNVALRSVQGPAFRREQMRAEERAEFGQKVSDPDVTPEGFEARRKVVERPRTVLIGPDGQPLPNQEFATVSGAPPLPSEQATGVTPTVVRGEQAARSGEFVWMGGLGTTTEEAPRFGELEVTEDAFMHVEDAVTLPYRWTPAQVAYAQEAMGLDPTGFVDQQLVNGWAQIIASAAGYAQAGRKVDPFMLLDMTFDATQAAKRGAGGGGGGGAALSLSQTTGFLNAVMLEEVGREATDAEAEQFHAAFLGAGEVDPTQFATDWIRSVVGGEAGVFQAATDFYTAMLQVLGAQTQAEEGPQ